MNDMQGIDNPQGGVCCGSHRARFSAWALAALAALFLATPVAAQVYKSYEPSMTEREARAMRGKISLAIRNPDGFGADAGAVNDYFKKYYFLKMTGTSPESLRELGDMREDLFRRYLRATPSAESQATLTSLVLKVATALSQDNYHPAVRYNATLILGNLDQQITGKNNSTPPIPLPVATAVMLDLLEQDDFKGVKVHPSVRLGALVGLERHARFGIAAQHAPRVVKAALDLISQEEPTDGVSEDVHQWIKCRAASVLAYLHKEKAEANVLAVLNGMLTDENLSLEDRCFVAGLLELMSYSGAAEEDSRATLEALGRLSQDVLKAEAKLVEDYQEEVLGTSDFSSRRRPAARFGEEDSGPTYGRRQLLSQLRPIYNGGRALAEDIADPVKSQVEELLDAMKPARLAAADKKSTDLDIAEAVLQAVDDVDRVIQTWNQGVEPAEPAEADFS